MTRNAISKTQQIVLDDLVSNGPVTIHPYMGWPERDGKTVLFRGCRATSMTFNALQRQGLISWEPITVGGYLTRMYTAKPASAEDEHGSR